MFIMTKKPKNRSKKLKSLRLPTLIEVIMLIIGAALGTVLGVVAEHYIYPLYFMPHSHLRILKGGSMFTIDNIQGDVPVDWLEITVKTKDAQSLIRGYEISGSLDVKTREGVGNGKYTMTGNYFWLVINNIAPKTDFGTITVTLDGPQDYDIEVKSSSQYEVGGKVSIGSIPTHGAWGSEESFGDWLKKNPSYTP
jgi:hypothetical protein